MGFDEAKLKRDRRLRKMILSALHFSRRHGPTPTGELDAITVRDVAESSLPENQKFEDEGHAISLIRDLRDKGLIEERVVGLRRGQRFGLVHLVLSITAKGSALINETIPVDPDIDDERIEA